MTDCTKYRNLIEQYLDGIIADGELAELRAHMATCPPCREEFDRCVLVQSAVKQAFSSGVSTKQAVASVLKKLPVESNRFVGSSWLTGRRAAIAAGIFLAVGLLAGFALGKLSGPGQAAPAVTAEVPIGVGDVQGMVLVRHEGSGLWQVLKADSKIHLGDTFHAGAKSACVLKLDAKSTIELNQNSMLVLKLYNGETQFYLEHGQLSAALESPHPPFFISTPHGRVEALGTEFTVTVE
jgi:ferric-dicitrate binding protein FerR (iron transport regulator)